MSFDKQIKSIKGLDENKQKGIISVLKQYNIKTTDDLDNLPMKVGTKIAGVDTYWLVGQIYEKLNAPAVVEKKEPPVEKKEEEVK
jgi:hypothetical protein